MSSRQIPVPKIRQLPSGAYHCQIRPTGPDGRKRSVSITDADPAVVEAKALAIKAGVIQEQQTPRSSLTLRQAIDRYIEDRRNILSPSTLRGYRTISETRFVGYMDRRLDSLTERLCRRMVNEEARIVSPKTVKNAWGLVASVLRNELGVEYSVPLPQQVPADAKFLTYDEILSFCAAVRDTEVEIPALLALHSLRRSEILALTWDRIDLDRGLITVAGAAVLGENHKLVTKPANKTRSSRRTIPIMIPRLRTVLEETEPKEGRLVHCDPCTIYKRINRICEQEGLPLVGVHGLRHSFASLASHLGLPPKITMQIGGWANDATMTRIYTHIAEKDVSASVAQIKDFFRDMV